MVVFILGFVGSLALSVYLSFDWPHACSLACSLAHSLTHALACLLVHSLVHSIGIAATPGVASEAMADAAANVLELPATEHFRSFEHAFKDVWGNNADAISLLYRY